ncbi:hypothetical protein F5Y12DRAFT_680010 [Xylaria sp. FL1777]|nr:hypothetical protein F5Y12DRAFT_680010 [Xylaria sp. FL1777]
MPSVFTSVVVISGSAVGSGSAGAFTSSVCTVSEATDLLSSAGESSAFPSEAGLGESSVAAGGEPEFLEDSDFDFPCFPFFPFFSDFFSAFFSAATLASSSSFFFSAAFLASSCSLFFSRAFLAFLEPPDFSFSTSAFGSVSDSTFGSASGTGSGSGSVFGCSGSDMPPFLFFFFLFFFFSSYPGDRAGASSRVPSSGPCPSISLFSPFPGVSRLQRTRVKDIPFCSVSDRGGS